MGTYSETNPQTTQDVLTLDELQDCGTDLLDEILEVNAAMKKK
jgi:hypothetical protein